jgi:predicted metal-dependent phosphotriesterase family hydrolase
MIDGQFSLKDAAIPQTICDAMELVKLMGEQYLWVDALCIVQDDPIDVGRHIQRMDRVYKAAQFTIINASGVDANAGLEGLELGSRNLHFSEGTIDGVKLI